MVLEADVLPACHPLGDLLGDDHLPDDLLAGGDLLGDDRLPDDLLAGGDLLAGDAPLAGTELLLEADRISRGDLDLPLLEALLVGEAILLPSLGCCDIFTTTQESQESTHDFQSHGSLTTNLVASLKEHTKPSTLPRVAAPVDLPSRLRLTSQSSSLDLDR